jgi:hypothetical protein
MSIAPLSVFVVSQKCSQLNLKYLRLKPRNVSHDDSLICGLTVKVDRLPLPIIGSCNNKSMTP